MVHHSLVRLEGSELLRNQDQFSCLELESSTDCLNQHRFWSPDFSPDFPGRCLIFSSGLQSSYIFSFKVDITSVWISQKLLGQYKYLVKILFVTNTNNTFNHVSQFFRILLHITSFTQMNGSCSLANDLWFTIELLNNSLYNVRDVLAFGSNTIH